MQTLVVVIVLVCLYLGVGLLITYWDLKLMGVSFTTESPKYLVTRILTWPRLFIRF